LLVKKGKVTDVDAEKKMPYFGAVGKKADFPFGKHLFCRSKRKRPFSRGNQPGGGFQSTVAKKAEPSSRDGRERNGGEIFASKRENQKSEKKRNLKNLLHRWTRKIKFPL